MRLSGHEYRTVSSIAGPLLFLRSVFSSKVGEEVRVVAPDGSATDGEVLAIRGDTVLVQVYGETSGLDIGNTSVLFSDSMKKAPVSPEMIGRVFDGTFRPQDGMPMYIPEERLPVSGFPINPAARARPEEFVETGFSAIDGLNTLVRGQKLPIFSCAGLPSKELVAGILRHAAISGRKGKFAVVFAALGLTFQEQSFYMNVLREIRTGFVSFINMAEEPVMERLMAPRFALSAAEYLAFRKGYDILVIITDMTNYCDALREISTSRKELPGRRGYPGYMYSDLASLYERAGRIRGMEGSVTLLPVITMPEDDITHPIADLSGYITEGQIVLSRELHRKGVFPPVDVLPSLSRLMQRGIGEGHTRKDHRQIANGLYARYARGRDLRRLEAIVGREGMTDEDRKMLDFADSFEAGLISQADGMRSIGETLDKGLSLISEFTL